MTRRRVLTPEQCAEIIRLYRADEPLRQIANRMGVTIPHVNRVALEAGLRRYGNYGWQRNVRGDSSKIGRYIIGAMSLPG